jgi:hypothetical protein
MRTKSPEYRPVVLVIFDMCGVTAVGVIADCEVRPYRLWRYARGPQITGAGLIRLVDGAAEWRFGTRGRLRFRSAAKRSVEDAISGCKLRRYFFHVVDGTLPIEDDQGTPFDGPADAVAHAEIIANELAHDDDQYRGYTVVVVDEQENVIAWVPITRRTH